LTQPFGRDDEADPTFLLELDPEPQLLQRILPRALQQAVADLLRAPAFPLNQALLDERGQALEYSRSSRCEIHNSLAMLEVCWD
jgi:hypothetical protein